MRTFFVVIALAALFVAPLAFGGERAVCKVWLDDAGIVARSTAPAPLDLIGVRPHTAGLAYTTLDGRACPANRLQFDAGIVAWDAGTGFEMTAQNGQPTDGGVAGCPFCDFAGATSLAFQCLDSTTGLGIKVYYSEKWDGGVDKWNQRGVVPATANDQLIDFSLNSDPYRVDFRGSASAGQSQHISVKPFAASTSAYCIFETIKRVTP